MLNPIHHTRGRKATSVDTRPSPTRSRRTCTTIHRTAAAADRPGTPARPGGPTAWQSKGSSGDSARRRRGRAPRAHRSGRASGDSGGARGERRGEVTSARYLDCGILENGFARVTATVQPTGWIEDRTHRGRHTGDDQVRSPAPQNPGRFARRSAISTRPSSYRSWHA